MFTLEIFSCAQARKGFPNVIERKGIKLSQVLRWLCLSCHPALSSGQNVSSREYIERQRIVLWLVRNLKAQPRIEYFSETDFCLSHHSFFSAIPDGEKYNREKQDANDDGWHPH